MSFKPTVQTDSTGKWYSNGLRFATEAEALASSSELSCRWMAVRANSAEQSDDPVNYAWVDGAAVAVQS